MPTTSNVYNAECSLCSDILVQCYGCYLESLIDAPISKATTPSSQIKMLFKGKFKAFLADLNAIVKLSSDSTPLVKNF